MKKFSLLLIFLGGAFLAKGQELTASQLLDKTIAYHDPNGQWQTFVGTLNITFTDPKESKRESEVYFNFPKDQFKLSNVRSGKTIESILDSKKCSFKVEGLDSITEEDKKKFRLNCDRAKMMKNYYSYLYGLPMKLKDKGTIIDPKVTTKKFKEKEYLVLKATYDETVGKDTWYFYFDPKTYAMEVYQFFHDESKNDGEYILLKDEKIISGIKMPKNRTWYYNKEDKLLGTDSLK